MSRGEREKLNRLPPGSDGRSRATEASTLLPLLRQMRASVCPLLLKSCRALSRTRPKCGVGVGQRLCAYDDEPEERASHSAREMGSRSSGSGSRFANSVLWLAGFVKKRAPPGGGTSGRGGGVEATPVGPLECPILGSPRQRPIRVRDRRHPRESSPARPAPKRDNAAHPEVSGAVVPHSVKRAWASCPRTA